MKIFIYDNLQQGQLEEAILTRLGATLITRNATTQPNYRLLINAHSGAAYLLPTTHPRKKHRISGQVFELNTAAIERLTSIYRAFNPNFQLRLIPIKFPTPASTLTRLSPQAPKTRSCYTWTLTYYPLEQNITGETTRYTTNHQELTPIRPNDTDIIRARNAQQATQQALEPTQDAPHRQPQQPRIQTTTTNQILESLAAHLNGTQRQQEQETEQLDSHGQTLQDRQRHLILETKFDKELDY